MQRKITKLLQRHSILLSLLLHFLFFTTYAISLYDFLQKNKLINKEPLPSYVPSYTQQEVPQQRVEKPDNNDNLKPIEKPKLTDKHGIEKPVAPREVRFSRNQTPVDISDSKNSEPMHLIGETKIIKPLIKILAKALQEHLIYPKIAQDFNLRGVVLVGFRLHPQGYITETKIVQSSGAGVLDDAARKAVNGMSPLPGVGEYMKDSEFLVVGIIFG